MVNTQCYFPQSCTQRPSNLSKLAWLVLVVRHNLNDFHQTPSMLTRFAPFQHKQHTVIDTIPRFIVLRLANTQGVAGSTPGGPGLVHNVRWRATEHHATSSSPQQA